MIAGDDDQQAKDLFKRETRKSFLSYFWPSYNRRAVEEPLRMIAENAGHEGSIVVNKVKESANSVGFNASTETTARNCHWTRSRWDCHVSAQGSEVLYSLAQYSKT